MIPVIVILIFSLDRLSKYLISVNLLPEQSVPVLNNIFHLTLVHNKGAAFGLLKNQVPFFIFIAFVALILIYFNLRNNRFVLSRVCLAFILAGTLGNLTDRILFGYVIDFLDFRIWPVFNVADSAITIGAILLGYTILRTKSEERKA